MGCFCSKPERTIGDKERARRLSHAYAPPSPQSNKLPPTLMSINPATGLPEQRRSASLRDASGRPPNSGGGQVSAKLPIGAHRLATSNVVKYRMGQHLSNMGAHRVSGVVVNIEATNGSHPGSGPGVLTLRVDTDPTSLEEVGASASWASGGGGSGGGGSSSPAAPPAFPPPSHAAAVDTADEAADTGAKYATVDISMGKPRAAALGILAALRVEAGGAHHVRIISDGVREIAREFDPERNPECDAKDAARFEYIFSRSAALLEQDNGVRRDIGNEGKTLDDFLKHDNARKAGLKTAHVLALRLYTSNSHARINGPLRATPQPVAGGGGASHPYAATVYFIADGLKKLRASLLAETGMVTLGKGEAEQGWPRYFWRGLAGVAATPSFIRSGGTEMACMSTTREQAVAEKFAKSKVASPLLLKFEVDSHMSCGADISWLSMYPEEKEVLFPPLTYLRVVKKTKKGGKTVVVVKPELG